jgi:hypothetical protein
MREKGVKRLTLKFALCLIAGAVVTWGGAWGCALWGSPPGQDEKRWEVRRWPPQVPGQWPPPSIGVGVGEWYGTQTLYAAALEGDPSDEAMGRWTEFGLPFRAMRRTKASRQTLDGVGGSAVSEVVTAVGRWELPGEVVPVGFALNTLLAACVVLGVMESLALAWRRVRRAKGRCVACGYDRGGLVRADAACPECGGVA